MSAPSYLLRTQMIAPVSLEEAFAIFEDPRNLAKITPPWLNFRILTPEPITMKRGAVFDYRFRWFGLPLSWQTIITDYEPPFYFVDFQAKGPYRLWRHRHSFKPSVEGTIVTDEVEFILPFGWLGKMALKFAVAEQLKEIFRFRQQTLNTMMCGGRGRWTEPAITAYPSAQQKLS
ncbi:MAG: SRPBCC family protein [Bryobacteraceae bacterium]|nr:SRPBCC family protein [Bryobacteraceae bacterium]MDW8379938.1 SRPBCC family protein [Bryobacterales bacterium]